MTFNNCEIVVNDLFDELSEENKRLFNELLFANKCLNKLQEFKYSFYLYSNKIRQSLESNEWQILEKLLQELNGFVIRKNIRTKNNELTSDDNEKGEDVLLPKIETSDQSIVCGLKSSDHYMDCEETESSDYANDKEEEREEPSVKKNRPILRFNKVDDKSKEEVVFLRCQYTGCDQIFSTVRQFNEHSSTMHLNDNIGDLLRCPYDNCRERMANEAHLTKTY